MENLKWQSSCVKRGSFCSTKVQNYIPSSMQVPRPPPEQGWQSTSTIKPLIPILSRKREISSIVTRFLPSSIGAVVAQTGLVSGSYSYSAKGWWLHHPLLQCHPRHSQFAPPSSGSPHESTIVRSAVQAASWQDAACLREQERRSRLASASAAGTAKAWPAKRVAAR